MDARESARAAGRWQPPVWGLCLAIVAWALPTAPVEAFPFAKPQAYRTQNFLVRAPSPELAREIGEAAEAWRERLAVEWIGSPMPNWGQPCPIEAKVAPNLGAGGATTFVFDRGEVFGWDMNVQGTRARVLDSVLPHEITHTVFATYFRQPLPRWADEGACTTVEHASEIGKQERLLIQFLKTNKGIPFSEMFAMKEYPPEVLPLYAQGHSLTQFLIERRGRAAFLEFLEDGMADENWRRAVATHYQHENLYALQQAWLDWVKAGRPRLAPQGTQVASATPQPLRAAGVERPLAPVGKPSVYSAGLSGGAMASLSARSSGAAITPLAAGPPSAPTPSRASVYDASLGETRMWR
ncbi:MAG: hypothetical protein ACRCT8_15440 [Lacipirellulaceae bacterium]